MRVFRQCLIIVTSRTLSDLAYFMGSANADGHKGYKVGSDNNFIWRSGLDL